jgi:hypothetical protein
MSLSEANESVIKFADEFETGVGLRTNLRLARRSVRRFCHRTSDLHALRQELA